MGQGCRRWGAAPLIATGRDAMDARCPIRVDLGGEASFNRIATENVGAVSQLGTGTSSCIIEAVPTRCHRRVDHLEALNERFVHVYRFGREVVQVGHRNWSHEHCE